MGISRQPKSVPGTAETPRKVFVLRSGGLGDFILTLPVLAAVRQAYPDAVIELLGKPEIAELGRDRYYLNSVTSIHQARFARLFGEEPLASCDPVATYLSAFDLAISFMGSQASSLGVKLSGLIAQTIFIPQPSPGGGHVSRQFLAHLHSIAPGLTMIEPPPPRLSLSDTDCRKGREILRRLVSNTEQLVVIHPGSGSPRKNWSPAYFAGVAGWFQDHGFEVILLQGEADELPIQQVLAAARTRELPVLRDLQVVEAAQALAVSRLLIGNDSGISHLAAATGIPVLALFGATDPGLWRPLGARVAILTWDEATPQRVVKEAQALL